MTDKPEFEIVDVAWETNYETIHPYALPNSINHPSVPGRNKLGVGDFENVHNVNAAEREFLLGKVDGAMLVRGDDVPLEFNYQSERDFKSVEWQRQQVLPQNSYLSRTENNDIVKEYINEAAEKKGMPPTLEEMQKMSAADGIPINESQLPEPEPETEIETIPEPETRAARNDLDKFTAVDSPVMEAPANTEVVTETETAKLAPVIAEQKTEPKPEPIVKVEKEEKPAATIASTPAKPVSRAQVDPENIADLLAAVGATEPIIATRVIDENSTALPEFLQQNSPANTEPKTLSPMNKASYQRLSTVYAPDGISKAESNNLEEFANLLGEKEAAKDLTQEDLSKLADYQAQSDISQMPAQVSNVSERSKASDIKPPSF